MSEILIIAAHPALAQSAVNRRLLNEAAKHPDCFSVHHLESAYPDGNIDVAAEQNLVGRHRAVVWQFPVYWFSSPPLLKAWQDEVLTYGWAYGRGGDAFKGKKLALTVSTGIDEAGYSRAGQCGYDIAEVLRPFELTARYIGADYAPPFVCYDGSAESADDAAAAYLQFLNRL